MKWGVRRYQNKDGTLTSAGKKRQEREIANGDNKHKKPNPNKWVRDDIERTKRLTDASSNAVGQLKSINNKSRTKSRSRMNLDSMSDKELRDRINREFLEKQYNDLFAPQKTTKGREYASEILETTGNTLAVASSALGIALAIKELRG